MIDPAAMSTKALRDELRHGGITSRYVSFLMRELATIGDLVADPNRIPTAHWHVFKAHGLLNREGEVNRRGGLILELANRELEEERDHRLAA